MYRGVFGCHVALILRRLRRLAALYGAAPRFVCCSATVGNPRQLFTELTGLDKVLLLTEHDDGSPHGRRTIVLWNPPLRSTATPLPPGKGVPLPGKGVLLSHEVSPGAGAGAGAVGAGAGAASDEAGAAESESGGASPKGGGGDGGSAMRLRLRPRESSAEEGRRESSNIEAAVLLAELVRMGLKTICFCSVREIGEI